MPRATTPSYVCEFEVRATSKDRRVLRSRLEAGRQLYNAVLGDALKRLARMRRDPGFELAKALPMGSSKLSDATPLEKTQAKVRRDAFRALREKHGFREFDLHQHRSLSPGCWIRQHLDINTAQKVATRAFKAADRWSFAQSGKPRFKRYGELESLEGKANTAGIRFREDRILWSGTHGKLDLPLVVLPGDAVHAHALAVAQEDGGVKYCRLLLRAIRGRERAFVQLVLEGQALRKPKHLVGKAEVGLDLGPSQVAVVAKSYAETKPFCVGLGRKEAARRRYLRKLERQRRANNPENYHPDGTVKPRRERKCWEESIGQKETRKALAEVLRAMAAQRKSLQGELVHQVLTVGNRIRTEQVNVRSWATLWGRSTGHKAPGTFQARLKTLALASGGSFEEVNTRTTFLSSRCLCSKRKKKELRERKHTCDCKHVPPGTWVDRDEFSAFLALHAEGGRLDEQAARESWQAWGVDILLHVSSGFDQAANGGVIPLLWSGELQQSGSQPSGSSVRKASGHAGEERIAYADVLSGAPAPSGTLVL